MVVRSRSSAARPTSCRTHPGRRPTCTWAASMRSPRHCSCSTGAGPAGPGACQAAVPELSADGRSVSYSSSSQALAGVPVPQGFAQAYVAHLTPFPRADLAMVRVESPAQVVPGEPWTITASAENRGPDAVDRVAVLAGGGPRGHRRRGRGRRCRSDLHYQSPRRRGRQQVVTCVTESLVAWCPRARSPCRARRPGRDRRHRADRGP